MATDILFSSTTHMIQSNVTGDKKVPPPQVGFDFVDQPSLSYSQNNFTGLREIEFDGPDTFIDNSDVNLIESSPQREHETFIDQTGY